MHPFALNGEVWRVVKVAPGDPRLIDRTGNERLATTDPNGVIYLSDTLAPPLLDKVLLHEIAHAITVSYGLLDILRRVVPYRWWIFVEEWTAQLVEEHGIEAAAMASKTLGRPVCVGGYCYD